MSATPLPRRPGPTTRVRRHEHLRTDAGDQVRRREDRVITEEPLEIRLAAPGLPGERLAVTMRTPGHDFELAVGWLTAEGITTPDAIHEVRYCTAEDVRPDQEFNVVTVELDRPPLSLPPARTVTAACGVCGSEEVASVSGPRIAPVSLSAEVVHALPETLRDRQQAFARTGGAHAAGLFGQDGRPVVVREDVGRHNAVDKVIGHQLLAHAPMAPVLVLSGRIGFELVQKAVTAGVGALVAVGAPSSLAVQVAEEHDRVLIGFTGRDRFVVYAGHDRVN